MSKLRQWTIKREESEFVSESILLVEKSAYDAKCEELKAETLKHHRAEEFLAKRVKELELEIESLREDPGPR